MQNNTIIIWFVVLAILFIIMYWKQSALSKGLQSKNAESAVWKFYPFLIILSVLPFITDVIKGKFIISKNWVIFFSIAFLVALYNISKGKVLLPGYSKRVDLFFKVLIALLILVPIIKYFYK